MALLHALLPCLRDAWVVCRGDEAGYTCKVCVATMTTVYISPSYLLALSMISGRQGPLKVDLPFGLDVFGLCVKKVLV